LTQVYGGSVAIVFGAHLWSSSSFRGFSKAAAKETVVSRLRMTFSNCSITGSRAVNYVIGGAQFDSF
jgi:hypothetical protein